MTRKSAADLVTFEVLRHRLWEINDEMGLLAERISGSPAVYESGDFNCAILTPDGRGLFAGVYVIRMASALDLVVQDVLRRFGGDIADGDVFLTNDPWAGALHAMDAAVVAPVFADGELVAWTGIVMHELDVGGPRPGSWSVGARDAFAECPLLPPVKLVDGGVLRPDVEQAFLRNSRTPEINALNLRAKIASQLTTRERLLDIVREYGRDTFLSIQDQILEYVRATVRQRIASLPDGTFHATRLWDHDGNTDRIYRLKLTLRKAGDQLEFDFRGTDAQAAGPINCAYSGLVGGILQVLFPLLCFDVPWSHGAVWDCIDVVSAPGTLNNALHPAATSMATVNACQATGDLVWEAMARLYGCSPELREEVIALGYGGVNMGVLAGRRADGTSFVNLFTDSVGGGGARSFADGVDTSGNLLAPAYAIPNVERIESLVPVLYVYRRQLADTGGPGRYRGGVGLEFMITPHGTDEPMEAVFFSSGCSQPLSKGVFGGFPGPVQRNRLLREVDLRRQFAQGVVPTSVGDVGCASIDVMDAKDTSVLGPSDSWVNYCSGGGGLGDPLARPFELIADDVALGLCTAAEASARYGVVFGPGGSVDEAASTARRAAARRDRLAGARAPRREPPGIEPVPGAPVRAVGDSLEIVVAAGRHHFGCASCHGVLGPVDEDVRSAMPVLETGLAGLMPLNRLAGPDRVTVWVYCCPHCGAALSTDVHLAGTDEVVLEMSLRRPASPDGQTGVSVLKAGAAQRLAGRSPTSASGRPEAAETAYCRAGPQTRPRQ